VQSNHLQSKNNLTVQKLFMKSINVSATDSWWALERIALVTPKLTKTGD